MLISRFFRYFIVLSSSWLALSCISVNAEEIKSDIVSSVATKEVKPFSGLIGKVSGDSKNISLETGFSEVAEDLIPSVVNISTVHNVKQKNVAPTFPKGGGFGNSPFDQFLEEFFEYQMQQGSGAEKDRQVRSLGSGFIISSDGYIATNNHVIDGADEIIIKFHDDSTENAEIVGVDKNTDIAVLKVKNKTNLKPVKFGDSTKAKVGEFILAVGNPFGFGSSVNFGIISAKSRALNIDNNSLYNNYIQIDAAINRGNSGGPLFNIKGELIGINNAIYSPNGGNIGIGFSIPTEIAESVINQLKQKGVVTRGWIGVSIASVTTDIAKSLNLKNIDGAYVVEVKKDSPADKAGIRPSDIIIKFDGNDIIKSSDLLKYAPNSPIGKKVDVIVRREGKDITMPVVVAKFDESKLGGDKNNEIEQKNEADSSEKNKDMVMGMLLSPISDDLRVKYSIGKNIANGLVITKIDSSSELYKKGLREGNVLLYIGQKELNTLKDFTSEIERLKKSGIKFMSLILHGKGRNYSLSVAM